MPASKTPTPAQISDAVDAWFNTKFHNTTLSRDTAVFNAAVSALPDLKKSLCGLFAAEPPNNPTMEKA
jgi:hypothetical protein